MSLSATEKKFKLFYNYIIIHIETLELGTKDQEETFFNNKKRGVERNK